MRGHLTEDVSCLGQISSHKSQLVWLSSSHQLCCFSDVCLGGRGTTVLFWGGHSYWVCFLSPRTADSKLPLASIPWTGSMPVPLLHRLKPMGLSVLLGFSWLEPAETWKDKTWKVFLLYLVVIQAVLSSGWSWIYFRLHFLKTHMHSSLAGLQG